MKILIELDVPDNFESSLDMQPTIEEEIRADRWSWDVKPSGSDTDLLHKLIAKQKKFEAPHLTRRAGTHYEFLIGIGDNHSAYITLIDDAYEALLTLKQGVENEPRRRFEQSEGR
ncbi:MAG: hypothetical protein PF440_05745 [Thiomicrorhabdus sp.]|jgi:hypothetical protein|nr:hypothetical protein [Thiomicrorhabdus sp.]